MERSARVRRRVKERSELLFRSQPTRQIKLPCASRLGCSYLFVAFSFRFFSYLLIAFSFRLSFLSLPLRLPWVSFVIKLLPCSSRLYGSYLLIVPSLSVSFSYLFFSLVSSLISRFFPLFASNFHLLFFFLSIPIFHLSLSSLIFIFDLGLYLSSLIISSLSLPFPPLIAFPFLFQPLSWKL